MLKLDILGHDDPTVIRMLQDLSGIDPKTIPTDDPEVMKIFSSMSGYTLLWVVTLSTVMLILLQHNVAHLGIATGLCLSEAAHQYLPKWLSVPVLGSAVLASISTSLAEILGGAIALQMLFDVPIPAGALLTAAFVAVMLFTNSYRRVEKGIIAFVSLIGFSFLYELFLIDVDWPIAMRSAVVPSIPEGSMLIVMSVLGCYALFK